MKARNFIVMFVALSSASTSAFAKGNEAYCKEWAEYVRRLQPGGMLGYGVGHAPIGIAGDVHPSDETIVIPTDEENTIMVIPPGGMSNFEPLESKTAMLAKLPDVPAALTANLPSKFRKHQKSYLQVAEKLGKQAQANTNKGIIETYSDPKAQALIKEMNDHVAQSKAALVQFGLNKMDCFEEYEKVVANEFVMQTGFMSNLSRENMKMSRRLKETSNQLAECKSKIKMARIRGEAVSGDKAKNISDDTGYDTSSIKDTKANSSESKN